MKKFFLLLFFSSCMMFSCAAPCQTVKSFHAKQELQTTRNDIRVVIKSQVTLKEEHMTPSDVVEVIDATKFASQLRFQEFGPKKHKELDRRLSSVIVLIVKDSDEIKKFWKRTEDKASYGAMTMKAKHCCVFSKDAEWVVTIAQHKFLKENPSTLIHEILHHVSDIYLGAYDVNHVNKKMWMIHKDPRALQNIIYHSLINSKKNNS